MITESITTIVSVWNAVLTTFGVIGVSVYASSFRMRVRCLVDTNNVVRVRLINCGRLEGEAESVQIVVRNSLLHRVIYNGGKIEVLEVVDPPDDRRMKSGSVQSWWTRVDLTAETSLPSTDWLQRRFVTRTPTMNELRVRVQSATGRCKYRRLRQLSGAFHEIPAALSDGTPPAH